MENNSESADQEKLGVCREASGESPGRSVGMLAQSIHCESSPSPTTAFSYVSYSMLSTENQSRPGACHDDVPLPGSLAMLPF